MSDERVSELAVEVFGGLVFGDAAEMERVAPLGDELDRRRESAGFSMMAFGALRALLLRCLRDPSSREYIRLVAELRISHADSWPEWLRVRPVERLFEAMLFGDQEVFGELEPETGMEMVVKVLVMLAEDARLGTDGVAEVVGRARDAAERLLATPEAQAVFAQQRQQ